MADLLLEFFSEEIPARMQARAANDLARMVGEGLRAESLDFKGAQCFATPRRLTLAIEGLPGVQPDRREERKGPKVGAPEKAVNGFLGSVGLTLDEIETRETGKGAFYFAVTERKGRPTAEVAAEVIGDVARRFPWPRSMRWGPRAVRWVRPLHSILCVLDGNVVPLTFDGIASGNVTRGHRFMAPDAITVHSFDDYKAALTKACVVLDAGDRRERILSAARNAASGAGLALIEDEGLLAEVAGLVEWPVVLLGTFDERFLNLPQEVLMTSMRTHQKYFSLRDPATGNLAPRFAVVANLEAEDGGKRIVEGNERVLKARLSDAGFFWEQDRARPLDDRLPALEDMVFHAELGSMGDKTARIRGLAAEIARAIGADVEAARRAGQLSKADLVTEMVFEFPELQGVMGGYYAREQRETEAVAAAIRDHYRPAGPDDRIPETDEGAAVALADKIDALGGFFGIGEKPTGSKDPYALRRAALGVIRIILEKGYRLQLSKYFRQSDFLYAEREAGSRSKDVETVMPELLDFFADRLKVHLRGEGVRHDLIAAVFALGGQDDLVLLMARVRALADFIESDDGANLLVAYQRAANIVRIEEKKDAKSYDGTPDQALFAQDEEKALFARIASAKKEMAEAVAAEDFAAAMAAMARLRGPVDTFFDEVTVNTGDPAVRENRLRLLSEIRSALDTIAKFSEIEG